VGGVVVDRVGARRLQVRASEATRQQRDSAAPAPPADRTSQGVSPTATAWAAGTPAFSSAVAKMSGAGLDVPTSSMLVVASRTSFTPSSAT
jgi:hypothetical protein